MHGCDGGTHAAGALPPPVLPVPAPGGGRGAALGAPPRVLRGPGRCHPGSPLVLRPARRGHRLRQSPGELEWAPQALQPWVPPDHLLPRPGSLSDLVLLTLHGVGVLGLRGGSSGAQVHQRAQECVRVLRLLQSITRGRAAPTILPQGWDLSVLKDNLDLTKVAVMGHSFGGITAVLALVKEPSFRCAVALDAWMFPLENLLYPEVPGPVLFINTEKFQTPESAAKMRRLSSRNSQSRIVTVLGTVHEDQTDFAFLPKKLFSLIFGRRGTLEPHRALAITSRAALAFLHRHLELQEQFGQWDELLEGVGDAVVPDVPFGRSHL
ncbi:platelet-activating factor acetylhydrolase 2, cytoplasmic isoform 2-T9 [Geothlypis trichas]